MKIYRDAGPRPDVAVSDDAAVAAATATCPPGQSPRVISAGGAHQARPALHDRRFPLHVRRSRPTSRATSRASSRRSTTMPAGFPDLHLGVVSSDLGAGQLDRRGACGTSVGDRGVLAGTGGLRPRPERRTVSGFRGRRDHHQLHRRHRGGVRVPRDARHVGLRLRAPAAVGAHGAFRLRGRQPGLLAAGRALGGGLHHRRGRLLRPGRQHDVHRFRERRRTRACAARSPAISVAAAPPPMEVYSTPLRIAGPRPTAAASSFRCRPSSTRCAGCARRA